MDHGRIFRERVSSFRPPLFVFYQWNGRLSHASRGYNSIQSRRAVTRYSKFQRRALEHVFRPTVLRHRFSRESVQGAHREKASCNGRAVQGMPPHTSQLVTPGIYITSIPSGIGWSGSPVLIRPAWAGLPGQPGRRRHGHSFDPMQDWDVWFLSLERNTNMQWHCVGSCWSFFLSLVHFIDGIYVRSSLVGRSRKEHSIVSESQKLVTIHVHLGRHGVMKTFAVASNNPLLPVS
jgi:hypothetical protein